MERTLIIAEAGVNHNGDIELAKKLAYTAKEAGADVVKYQTANVDMLVTEFASMANYQEINTQIHKSQKSFLRGLQLSEDEFYILKEFCENIHIMFVSTPFDNLSIDFLSSFNMPFWKIPSGEITNYPYLVKIAKTKKKVILSTGMSNLDEVENAFSLLKKSGTEDISILHCTSQYPTPFEDVNLNVIPMLKEKFHVTVGYSDHTMGIEIPIAAVAMGARIIEKHFTLDRNMEGPDHKASLEPNELKKMVTSIRNIEMALGDGEKKVSKSERENIIIARKSIVASKKIKKGEILTSENVTTKRPGSGINPMRWNEVIGTVAIRDFEEDEIIETGKK